MLPPGATAVESPVPGSVWKILVEPGAQVAEGETLIIVESMKMEIAVCAPSSGLVREVRCAEGRAVQLGQTLVDHGGGAAMTVSLDIATLERLYAEGEATPEQIVREVYARITAKGVRPDLDHAGRRG